MGRTACTEPQCLYKGVLYFYLYFMNTKYKFPYWRMNFFHRQILHKRFNSEIGRVYDFFSGREKGQGPNFVN